MNIMLEKNIGIIGYGSMGKMIFSKILESKTIDESYLYLSNRTHDKITNLSTQYPELNICTNNNDVAKNADILFICVKPLEIKTVLLEILGEIKNNCHIISLNGSVSIHQLEQIHKNRKISKIIPSVTAEINQSVTLICHNNHVTPDDKNELKKILEYFGTTIEIPETEMGMGSELTSCMPGFIGALFKVITDEAKKHTTLNEEIIINMVIETVYGTGKLLYERKITFEQLIERVATKGGITEEGVHIIEEKMPEIMNELFEKTLEKRRITTEKAQKGFDS